MLTHIALAAELDPTISLGGELPAIGGNIRVGQGEHFICEACEYHQSFLRFFPLVSIILNVEEDHLDYFRDLQHIIDTFHALAELTPPDGAVIINADDENTCAAVLGSDARIITCSAEGKEADYRACEITPDEKGLLSFSVEERGEIIGRISLSVFGMHNVSNALCTVAASRFLGIPFEAIQKGLSDFTGVGRRFEIKGTRAGVTVVDDYAHHPTEIEATLRVASETTKGRVWCIFQPHTYTRTKTLFEDFKTVLANKGVLILDIYAAREKDTGLVNARELAAATPGATYLPSFEACTDFLRANVREGDMILTMGAGDVYRIGEMFLEK